MTNDITHEDRMLALFEPCRSKEELRHHMKAFLGIDLPSQIIDERSTSTPLDFIWSVYEVMLTGKGPTRHVVAASRGTTKTLSASLIRFYGMTHFRRDGTHLAAVEEQSKSANIYLDRFLSIPEIAPFVTTSNSKTRELTGLPKNSYTSKSSVLLRVAVATMSGVNSQRGSLNLKDETDLLPPSILAEASFVAEPTQDEHQFSPIEINLSSRKSNSGPIQSLLDEATSKRNPNLKVHMWSIVDWMRKCPDTLHQPEKPKIDAYINTENLKVTWGNQSYEALTSVEQSLQHHVVAFAGCVTCPAFVACQSRSVNQTGKMKNLRDFQFVGNMIDTVKDPEKLISQFLNWRPESSAIVFRAFSRPRHFLPPIAAYHWLFGEFFNPTKMPVSEIKTILDDAIPSEIARITPTKSDIYLRLVSDGWKIHYGVDWGYNPDPAVCLVIAYHKKQGRACVLHTEQALNHSNQDWSDYIATNIYPLFPCELVAPDMADKASPTYFRKHRMASLDTKPSRVETGVSQLRSLLWNVATQKENMIILDDGDYGENKWVAECFEKWSYAKNSTGYVFGKFDGDSEYTHPIDAARYALAPFIDQQNITVKVAQPKDTMDNIVAAARGDKKAMDELRLNVDKAAKNQLQDYFAREHGIKNIFIEEQKKPDPSNDKPTPPSGGGALRFKF